MLLDATERSKQEVDKRVKATVGGIGVNYLDDTLADSRFLIVLSSRQAAQMLAASAELPRILERAPAAIEVTRAPAPLDAYWPNLLASRFSRKVCHRSLRAAPTPPPRSTRLISPRPQPHTTLALALALARIITRNCACTRSSRPQPPPVATQVYAALATFAVAMLFLFWTIPVAFVQAREDPTPWIPCPAARPPCCAPCRASQLSQTRTVAPHSPPLPTDPHFPRLPALPAPHLCPLPRPADPPQLIHHLF